MFGVKQEPVVWAIVLSCIVILAVAGWVIFTSEAAQVDPETILGTWEFKFFNTPDPTSTFNFNADNTYYIRDGDMITEVGTWEYVKGARYKIYNDVYSTLDYEIRGNELVGLFAPETWVRVS